MTPTHPFIDRFFDAPGVPSAAAVEKLLGGNAPINADASISILGRINALRDISLLGGSISNTGVITSGAGFTGVAPDFSDIVNVNGLESANAIRVENGDILIVAAEDIDVNGVIAADGADGLDGGDVDILAGGDIRLNDGAQVSAAGRGGDSSGGNIVVFADNNAAFNSGATIDVSGGEVSGDGGFAEFSARKTVDLGGGEFSLGADDGTGGTLLIDPEDLVVSEDQFFDGDSHTLVADRSIRVDDDVTVSTRNVATPTTADHETAASEGDSGNLTLDAPQILLDPGSKLLTFADNGFEGGDITLQATHQLDPVLAALFGGETIANVELHEATLDGENVTISAFANSSTDFNDEPDPNNPNDESDEPGNPLIGALGFSPLAGTSISDATASILIGEGSTINATTLDMDAEAKTAAKTIVGFTGLAVAYAESNPTATIDVRTGTTIVATDDMSMDATAEGTLSATTLALKLGPSPATINL